MFTGLVQGQGEIRAVIKGSESRITIQPLFELSALTIGESIAVNGACLTVESIEGTAYTAYASAETMQHTTLGFLRAGSRVNLERALALGDRLGGHLVNGHVDCIAELLSIQPVGASWLFRLTYPEEWGIFVVYKGSVTLDGISLTVNKCGRDFLEVNMIPETQKSTTAMFWKIGTQINMETDILGKYVQHLLQPWKPAAEVQSRVTMDLLRENGFI